MSIYRKELPRLYELRDQFQSPPSREAYNFEIGDNRIKLKHFRDLEAELQGLDPVSWDLLKAELTPLFIRRDPKRAWQPLFDKLNEAKGYNYLVRMGCTNVEFVPRSSREGQKTPDVQGSSGATKVLCEVKTIDISENESACRKNGSVRGILIQLQVGFFNKLKSVLEKARDQMTAYCPTVGTIKIAYVIINYDDILHEYEAEYSAQIKAFIATNPVPELAIFFDARPAFYSATA
jgi:hypothetical protein